MALTERRLFTLGVIAFLLPLLFCQIHLTEATSFTLLDYRNCNTYNTWRHSSFSLPNAYYAQSSVTYTSSNGSIYIQAGGVGAGYCYSLNNGTIIAPSGSGDFHYTNFSFSHWPVYSNTAHGCPVEIYITGSTWIYIRLDFMVSGSVATYGFVSDSSNLAGQNIHYTFTANISQWHTYSVLLNSSNTQTLATFALDNSLWGETMAFPDKTEGAYQINIWGYDAVYLVDDIRVYATDGTIGTIESGAEKRLQIYTETSTGSALNIPVIVNGVSNNTPFDQYLLGSVTFTIPNSWSLNKTHRYIFLIWSDNSTALTITYAPMINDVNLTATYTASLIPKQEFNEGWYNFGIGLVGVGLIFAGFVFLKIAWMNGEYDKAIAFPLICWVIALGLMTVLVGA